MVEDKRLFRTSEIAAITSGRDLTRDIPDSWVFNVEVDSRNVRFGTLFIALRGERTDGHEYLNQAVKAGAFACVIDEDHIETALNLNLSRQGIHVIVVKDTLKALQMLAADWVRRFPSFKKIAVTGSCGKTTTKEMLSAILSGMSSTVKNPGNYNSEIGLPLSVFQIDTDDEFGVFEMGVNHIGEMDTMLDIYRPDYSVLTNIGSAHVGLLGSVENIAREKSKIFHKGVTHGYINEDNLWKGFVRDLRGLELREFGHEGTKGYQGSEHRGLQGWRISYEGEAFDLRLVGRHNLLNALAAIQVARDLGANRYQIAEGLESVEPLAGRSRVIQGDVTLIEDSYNANADSSKSILGYMGELAWEGRVSVVMGSMKELGFASRRSHEFIGGKIGELSPEAAFLYGKEMEPAYDMLKRENFSNRLFFTDDYEELEQEVMNYSRKGDLLLLKGSRSMAVDRLIAPLSLVS